ncbi:translocation/assembly module TamB domain-containing protein, partial [bacterium]|nr:translocation/assembly module TamB domain-containing protein [bacterium]
SYFSNVGRQKQSSGSQVYEKEAEESVFFNIAVRADDNVGVRSNLAEIDTSVDLILVGSNIAPGLKGSVDVIDGWATVLQNRYEITQATVQFYDEQRIFPSFDINAETEVKGTKIYVNVSGNPLNYRLSFRSDPPMSERDIFFLLATGVNYDEFMAGGSGVSGDEAAGIAAQQLVGSQISKLTGDTTGFEVGFDSSSGNTRLKVSGELEKDLYLTMYRGLVDEELGAELEYDFYRYVAGIGTWNNLAGYDDAPEVGAFGAGLRVKIDFQ